MAEPTLDLVFMGTSTFAVPSLLALHQAGHRIRAVVTQPDRPHGRGMRPASPAVKSAAVGLSLPVLQPPRASDPEFIARIAEIAPDLIVVVAYGQILKPALLAVPRFGCINLHGSLLPALRGAAPIQWAVIRGLTATGVTTMQMDAGMDTGDVLLQRTELIDPAQTAGNLAERLAGVGAELLLRTVDGMQRGDLRRHPQDSSLATLAPMLSRADGELQWDRSAVSLRNRIHGCNPSPGAFARRHGSVVKIWRAEALPASRLAEPGTVVNARDLTIATSDGWLRLLDVQPENRARLDGAAYCRGYRVEPGERWQDGF